MSVIVDLEAPGRAESAPSTRLPPEARPGREAAIRWAALAAGTLVTVVGFCMRPGILWEFLPGGPKPFALHLAGLLLLGAGLWMWLGGRAWMGWLAAWTLYSVGSVGLAGPASVAFLAASSWSLGDLVFRQLDAAGEPQEDWGLKLSCGLVLYMTAAAQLAHFPVNTPFFYAVLLSIALWANASRLTPALATMALRLGRVDLDRLETPAWWLAAVTVSFHLFHALMPEVQNDALVTHLMVPEYLLRHREWSFDFERHIWGAIPYGADWIFGILVLLGGEAAALLGNFAFLLLSAGLLFGILRRWLPRSTSLLLAAAYLSTPLLQRESGSLFLENLWVALLFAALLALERCVSRGRAADLVLLGCLGGGSLAVKVLAAPYLAASSLVLAWAWARRPDSRPSPAALAGASAAFTLCGLPSYAFAWWRTGNPVYPFMNQVFRSPFIPESFVIDNFSTPLGLTTLYDMVFHSSRFIEGSDGAMGSQLLLIVPWAAASLLSAPPAAVVIAAFLGTAGFGSTWALQSYLRYVTPVLPLLFAAVGWSFAAAMARRERSAGLFAALLGATTLLNLYFMPSSGWQQRHLSALDPLNPERREEHVRTFAPERLATRFLNASYGEGIHAAYLARPYVSGLHAEALTGSWYSFSFWSRLNSADSPEEVLRLFRDEKLTHVVAYREGSDPRPHAAVRDFLRESAELEYVVGDIGVWKVKPAALFTQELLINPDLRPGREGWQASSPVESLGKGEGAVVTQGVALIQAVPVNPKTLYRYFLTERCRDSGSLIRLQVNWHAKDGTSAGATLSTLACSDSWTTREADMRPPAAAERAVFYITGGSGGRVEVSRASFRR